MLTLSDTGAIIHYNAVYFCALRALRYIRKVRYTLMKKTVRSIALVLLVAVLSFAMLALVVGAEGEIYSADYMDNSGKVVALVTCGNDVFGSSELVVNEVSQAYDGFEVSDGYRKVLYAVDMSFVDNGIVKVFPGESFTVKIRVPAAIASEENILVYSLNSAGAFVPVTASVVDGYAVFTTSSFTTFALAISADAPVPFVNPDYTWVWVLVWILVILLVLGVIALLVIRYIKKKKEEFDSMAPTRRPSPQTGAAFGSSEETSDATETEQPAPEPATEISEPAAEVVEEPVVAVEEPAVEEAVEEPVVAVEEPVEDAVAEDPVIVAEEPAVEEPAVEESASEHEEYEDVIVIPAEAEDVDPEVANAPADAVAAAREAAAEFLAYFEMTSSTLDAVEAEAVIAKAEATEVPEIVAVEEPVVEVEPPKPIININFVDESEKEAGVPGTEEAVSVRFRTSFESRYIQSGVLQDYYTAIKNLLLSYKGVKARTSWNHESFNKGRQQCAKINIKGNALLVYLALDPANYNIKKYHFNDMSGKPKFDGTPMLMKVKSERALKYTLELIAEMMSTLEIPAGKAVSVDYHAPYETTEALAARGLVKIILPAGATLGDNLTAFKANVGAILEAEKSE